MSHYSEDCYDMYCCKFVTSDEPQQCMGANCKRTIFPGQKFARIVTQYDDERRTYIRCGACQVLHEHLQEIGEANWMFPAEELDCGKTYLDEHGCEPPPEIQVLAFLDGAEAAALLEGRKEPAEWDGREHDMVLCPVCEDCAFNYMRGDDDVWNRMPECGCDSKVALDGNNVCTLGDGQRYGLDLKKGALRLGDGEGAS